jgi:DNA-binding NarL/FixJ family response regulator
MMRVLVVDDHLLFRTGLRGLLEADGFHVVGEVGDGEAALAAATGLAPDLVLMDISMPGVNGLEALRLIKTQLPDCKVVMLSAFDDEVTVLEAIRSGADGYLLKSQDGEEFLAGLHSLEHGEMPIAPLEPRTP